jgi:DNA topoisomerase-1
LGEHPDKGGPVVVKNGRYGPYASHDGVNATLPSDLAPETITLEQAVALLDARSARGGKKRAAAKPRTAAAQAAAPETQPSPKPKATRKPKAAKPPAKRTKAPPPKSMDQ